jgi:tetratricopeptide (TPR) repeat protein
MKSKILLVVLALVVAGCSTERGIRESHRPAPQRPPVVANPLPSGGDIGKPAVIEPPISEAPVIPTPVMPDASQLASFPKSAESISSSAVISLLKHANEAREAGQPGQATAALERALRIEPRNYFVWSALATTYLQSKDYEQAESVAKKSNSLARGNIYAEQENWRVIREVRVAVGDAEGATAAQAHVDAIAQLLSASP